MARASARVTGAPIDLAPAPVVEASWANPYEVHPLDDVSISERADLLVGVTTTIADAGIPLAQASHQIWDTEKWFASSEGSRIDQHIVECGAVMDATAIGDGETQRRSYPGVRGQYGTRGLGGRARDRPPRQRARASPRRPRRCSARRSAPRRPPRSSSAASRWRSRSTSRSATPSSSTASSGGRPPSPARRGSTPRSSGRCATAPTS